MRLLRPAATRSRLQNPNLGAIVPNMGLIGTGLSEALFSKTQRKVLALLFGHADRSYYANEIVRYSNTGTGAVQRELERLSSVGLLAVKLVGNQRHYRANHASPIFEELRGIVTKTFGVRDILVAALAPLAARIDIAFVYGSVAKSTDTAASDIDMMIVSDSLTYADVFAAVEPATISLGRTVNPTVYTSKELSRRVKQGNAFAKRVLAQPKLWLVGGGNDDLSPNT